MTQYVEKTTETKVGEAVEDAAHGLASTSKLTSHMDEVAKVCWDDVEVKSPLGTGGYCSVFMVRVESDDLGKQSYALKCLKRKTRESDEDSFKQGAVDLVCEGEMLSRLRHKNIVKLHGVQSGSLRKAFTGPDNGYFLLLEVLEDTLTSRLSKMRKKFASHRNLITRKLSMSATLHMIQQVAVGVAEGMEYLHRNGVVLRDLKPDNIGFDGKDNPKIFDLGFAREVHTIECDELAGSLRYMAPEVALGKGTSFASDVYSFGVLLYEICTLEKPFNKMKSREMFLEEVVVGKYRPSTSKIQSPALRRLIECCWDKDPSERPEMSRVLKLLRIECAFAGSLLDSTGRRRTASNNKSRSMTSLMPMSTTSTPNLRWNASLSNSAGNLSVESDLSSCNSSSSSLFLLDTKRSLLKRMKGGSVVGRRGGINAKHDCNVSGKKNSTFDNFHNSSSSGMSLLSSTQSHLSSSNSTLGILSGDSETTFGVLSTPLSFNGGPAGHHPLQTGEKSGSNEPVRCQNGGISSDDDDDDASLTLESLIAQESDDDVVNVEVGSTPQVPTCAVGPPLQGRVTLSPLARSKNLLHSRPKIFRFPRKPSMKVQRMKTS